MRRHVLPPPRSAAGRLDRPLTEHDLRPPNDVRHVPMQAPRPAKAIPRRFLDPVSGWFRKLERRVNHLLTKHVYPSVPGIRVPYAIQLRRQLTLAEAEVFVPGLGPGFSGATVLLVTDLHSGPFLSAAASARVFERLAATEPDLILLGGDFASSGVAELEPHLPALRGLRAPLGVFAVLGNHDHYTQEPARVREALASCGIGVLHNTAVRLERRGSALLLAGIDDWNIGRPDLEGAIAHARSLDAASPIALLSHNPDALFAAERAGVALVLSGHTHGGQIRIPGLPVLARMSRYRLDEGRFLSGATEIVVSRGLGASGLPLRVACPPEAVRIVLRRPSDGQPPRS